VCRTSLAGLGACSSLQCIRARSNPINTLDALLPLAALPALTHIQIADTPFVDAYISHGLGVDALRNDIQILLPTVVSIDDPAEVGPLTTVWASASRTDETNTSSASTSAASSAPSSQRKDAHPRPRSTSSVRFAAESGASPGATPTTDRMPAVNQDGLIPSANEDAQAAHLKPSPRPAIKSNIVTPPKTPPRPSTANPLANPAMPDNILAGQDDAGATARSSLSTSSVLPLELGPVQHHAGFDGDDTARTAAIRHSSGVVVPVSLPVAATTQIDPQQSATTVTGLSASSDQSNAASTPEVVPSISASSSAAADAQPIASAHAGVGGDAENVDKDSLFAQVASMSALLRQYESHMAEAKQRCDTPSTGHDRIVSEDAVNAEAYTISLRAWRAKVLELLVTVQSLTKELQHALDRTRWPRTIQLPFATLAQ
jgi:hypothetical protein